MGVSWLLLDERSAAIVAVLLVLVALALRPARRRWSDLLASAALEIALVCSLFALWQLANSVAHHHVSGGLAAGRWIWHAERWLHVPSETTLQGWVLPHHGVVRAANYYYATAHLTGMVVFLVWLWVWHREQYARWRTTMAIFTGLALLVQIVPVAPPRLIGGTGLVDTAQVYGQSVYAMFDFADQYAAMPSIHVGWAVLIAVAAWQCSRGLFRYVGLAHGVATTLIVVVTANHYWFDGLAAVVLLALAWLAVRALEPRISLTLVPTSPLRLPSGVADGTMAS
ncbi:MAG TPA: phosphatase PAP2 family protein [Mycobacteriales bacterium]|nr:phosphatase PAP2 family protein [Mycobacteriales bacterium]